MNLRLRSSQPRLQAPQSASWLVAGWGAASPPGVTAPAAQRWLLPVDWESWPAGRPGQLACRTFLGRPRRSLLPALRCARPPPDPPGVGGQVAEFVGDSIGDMVDDFRDKGAEKKARDQRCGCFLCSVTSID